MEDNISESDLEFMNDRNIQNNINQNEFNINDLNQNLLNQQQAVDNLYNIEYYKLDNVIKILQNKNILKAYFICDVCGNHMQLVQSTNCLDQKIWRCRPKKNPAYDIKKI